MIVTRDTLDDVRAALGRRKVTIGIIGLVMPEYKLVRMVKMAFSREVVTMPHRQTVYNFQGSYQVL